MQSIDTEANPFAIIDGIPVDIESFSVEKKPPFDSPKFQLVIRDISWLHKSRIPNEIVLFNRKKIFVIFPAVVDFEVDRGEFHKSVLEISDSWSKTVDTVERLQLF